MFGCDGGSRRTAEEKRQAILSASLELFNERGYHATNVPLIAERAKVAVGTIYHHFPSKEAIVNELFQALKTELGRRMLEDFPFEAPMREQFREYWRRLTAYVLEQPEAFFFLEVHHHAPYLDEQSLAAPIPMMQAFEQAYNLAREQGVLRDISMEIVSALIMGTLTALVKAVSEGRIAITPEVLKQTEMCLWDAIAWHDDNKH